MKQNLLLLLAGFFCANAAIADVKPMQLAQQKNCLACHAVDHKIMGPAYKDVAEKYKNDAGAEARLIAKVKAGGGGVWGSVPMPANAVTDAEAHTLVDWVLSLKK